MLTPISAFMRNVTSVPVTLRNGHQDSVTVFPSSPSTTTQKVPYEFTTWEVLPPSLIITKYEMSDGSFVNNLSTIAVEPETNQMNLLP